MGTEGGGYVADGTPGRKAFICLPANYRLQAVGAVVVVFVVVGHNRHDDAAALWVPAQKFEGLGVVARQLVANVGKRYLLPLAVGRRVVITQHHAEAYDKIKLLPS